jgi:hypothetical protein
MIITEKDINLISDAIVQDGRGGGQIHEFLYDLTYREDRVGEVASFIEENMGDHISGYDTESYIGEVLTKITNSVFEKNSI